ncbi:MAG: hypothetical protein ACOCVC_06290 [Spirochaeta sp.]
MDKDTLVMYHPEQRKIDEAMKRMFDDIDHELEERYKGRFLLHPSRPRRGTTANPAADGLFNIGASFSPGYGSELGRGYVLDVHLATLENISPEERRQIEDDAVRLIRQKLPHYFPDRDLRLERDGSLFKIIGDFTLGST